VGAGRLGERVLAADADVKLALGDPCPQVARPPEQLGSVRHVVVQGGPGQEQRAAAVQPLRVHRRDLAAGGPVEHHQAARPQRPQAVVEGCRAHPVVDDVRAALSRDPAHGVDDLVVGDHVVGARLGRQPGLGRAGGRRHHDAAEPLDHLGEQ
jgi:hypothetical protein